MTIKPGFFKRVKALDFQQKKVFAIALCQRMLPNYQLFSQVCEFGDPQILDTVLNLLWQSCYDQKLKLNIDIYLERLELNTPDAADFDVYGVYPAMDASTSSQGTRQEGNPRGRSPRSSFASRSFSAPASTRRAASMTSDGSLTTRIALLANGK